MIDEALTKLIENIEDNLIKHVFDIKELLDAKEEDITCLVFSPIDKVYDATITTEDILNDPDNTVVSVVPKSRKHKVKDEICILSKDVLNDLHNKIVIGLNTIKDIKNNIISLSYTDIQTGERVVVDRLADKMYSLESLKYALERTPIANRGTVEKNKNDLLGCVVKLQDEIQRITTMRHGQNIINPAREYFKFISFGDIIDLVKDINKNNTDFDIIKGMLADCFSKQIQKLPIQNEILKENVFNAFCMMVKSRETNLFGNRILSASFRSGNKFETAINNQQIPKMDSVAKIAVDEWIQDYKDKQEENRPKQIDELLSMAVTYQLIPAPKFGSKSYKFEMACLESLHDLGFSNWIEEHKKLETAEPHDALCTWHNFQEYLKDRYAQEKFQKKLFDQKVQRSKEFVMPDLKKDKALTDSKSQQYEFDAVKVLGVYDFCVSTKIIDSSISNVDFINAVNKADFKVIHANAELQKGKSKCKYIIYILSQIINVAEWYKSSANSINTEPNKCSGITVPLDWRNQANALK